MTRPLASDLGALQEPQSFSLVLGGPLYQLLRRVHLSDDDAVEHVRRRIVVIALLAWLPLLVLSALEAKLLKGSATVPFLLDLEVHIRFLVAMPCLIGSELVVHRRMRALLKVFLERGLIPAHARERFERVVTSAFRLRNSISAELALVAFVYGVGVLIVWRQYVALDADTWYATRAADGTRLSLAGMWFGYVSMPIFQFLLCRWYFRLFIWSRFLWQVSRIRLALVPTHPDRVGGLGFLSGTAYAFTLLLVAHGALLAGYIANRIFFLGAALTDYKLEVGVMVFLLLCIVAGPLLVFVPQLAEIKRIGLREYGTLAERYVREFDLKWLRGGASADEPFVGSADIQSLADLNNSYDVVRSMRLTPVTRDAVIQLAAATFAPLAPLALTMMPLEELVKRLLGVLF